MPYLEILGQMMKETKPNHLQPNPKSLSNGGGRCSKIKCVEEVMQDPIRPSSQLPYHTKY